MRILDFDMDALLMTVMVNVDIETVAVCDAQGGIEIFECDVVDIVTIDLLEYVHEHGGVDAVRDLLEQRDLYCSYMDFVDAMDEHNSGIRVVGMGDQHGNIELTEWSSK